MRGKQFCATRHGVDEGITPADAGKTTTRAQITQRIRDHPRGCGENRNVIEFENRLPGSPPRMRGKRSVWPMNVPAEGITPADAGKTSILTFLFESIPDHPRGCGENTITQERNSKFVGSPPRMRGKPPDCHNRNRQVRITPADAGKTCCRACTPCRCRDHPRGCGENHALAVAKHGFEGSPPRMRGKQ